MLHWLKIDKLSIAQLRDFMKKMEEEGGCQLVNKYNICEGIEAMHYATSKHNYSIVNYYGNPIVINIGAKIGKPISIWRDNIVFHLHKDNNIHNEVNMPRVGVYNVNKNKYIVYEETDIVFINNNIVAVETHHLASPFDSREHKIKVYNNNLDIIGECKRSRKKFREAVYFDRSRCKLNGYKLEFAIRSVDSTYFMNFDMETEKFNDVGSINISTDQYIEGVLDERFVALENKYGKGSISRAIDEWIPYDRRYYQCYTMALQNDDLYRTIKKVIPNAYMINCENKTGVLFIKNDNTTEFIGLKGMKLYSEDGINPFHCGVGVFMDKETTRRFRECDFRVGDKITRVNFIEQTVNTKVVTEEMLRERGYIK